MTYKINYKTVTMEVAEPIGTVNTPQTAADLISNDKEHDPTVENMYLVAMNIKNDVHLKHLICKGSYNSMVMEAADIFGPCLRLNLRHFILVHNHPSGDPQASAEDIAFTAKIAKGAKLLSLHFLDHIILAGEDKMYSFKKEGLL